MNPPCFEIQGISINLTDSTQTNLTDESLPLSFDLSAWPAFNRTLAIYSFTNGTGSPTIGLIESITPGAPVSSVPVPAAIWLFGTALLGFLGFSQRRKHD